MEKKLLEKYFRNNCTESELELVLEWFRTHGNDSASKRLMYKIWNDLPDDGYNSGADFDGILSRIHHEVNLHESGILIDNFNNDPVRHNRGQYFMRVLKNVAAILMLPLLGTVIFFMQKYYSEREFNLPASIAYNELISSVDAITKVTLPDSSNVWLNHSSSLRYPAIFDKKSRIVELRGEGYFEVIHNEKVPFEVMAEGLKIKAVGTTFNVRAYPEEDRVETSLIAGVVEIHKVATGCDNDLVYKMKPTDLTVYKKVNGDFLIKTIGDDGNFSWKDGKLIFTAENMEEVIKKLNRWFNVEFEIIDPEIRDFPLTATFVSETLPQVMELLAMILPISYSISDRKEITNGEFSKQKVVIYKK